MSFTLVSSGSPVSFIVPYGTVQSVPMKSQASGKSGNQRGRPAKEGLREHLLMQTLEVLLRDGYDRFSMNAVAVSARASKETLYRYFCDKAGLLGAALEYLGSMVEPLLLANIHEEMSRPERLQQLADNYLNGCLVPESLTLQRIAYADGDKGLGKQFAKQFTEASLRVMTGQFEMLKTPDPGLDAEIFLAMVQGQVHEKALLGIAGKQELEKRQAVTSHAVRIFLAYLKAQS